VFEVVAGPKCSDADNLRNIRREVSRHIRNKKS
jgi:hypothetical protein